MSGIVPAEPFSPPGPGWACPPLEWPDPQSALTNRERLSFISERLAESPSDLAATFNAVGRAWQSLARPAASSHSLSMSFTSTTPPASLSAPRGHGESTSQGILADGPALFGIIRTRACSFNRRSSDRCRGRVGMASLFVSLCLWSLAICCHPKILTEELLLLGAPSHCG